MVMYDDAHGIYYEIRGTGEDAYAVITDADKKLSEIDIPCELDSCPVRMVGAKAFLGCKVLRRVSVPDTVRELGKWAFAFCDNLTLVELKRGKMILNKGVFKNDEKISEIAVFDDKEKDTVTARLLAAATVIMDAEYLLDTEHAGSAEWLGKWDTRLKHILSLKDDEGYHLYVLCGEEDLHFDYDEYLEYNRQKKSRLCMLRLVNDTGLKNDDRKALIEYLNAHTTGCESEAAIRVLLKCYGDDKDYYCMMIDIGALHRDNLEKVLFLMGDRHAAMKAYLMEELSGGDDFFDDLMI